MAPRRLWLAILAALMAVQATRAMETDPRARGSSASGDATPGRDDHTGPRENADGDPVSPGDTTEPQYSAKSRQKRVYDKSAKKYIRRGEKGGFMGGVEGFRGGVRGSKGGLG
jgi:hypothetical protein